MRTATGQIVSTVRGPRPVSDLGVTLAHEHIVIDTTPQQRSTAHLAPRMLLDYTSEAAVTDALYQYKLSGGSTIIEATPDGCGRNPEKLREISERLDLNIICAAGWYREENYPNHVLALGASGRADVLLRELALGIGSTGIRPGFIKVGTSAVITREEEVTLRAAARVQREAQVALAVHVTNIEWDGEGLIRAEMPAAHTILDILEHDGADLGKVSLCHADGTYLDSRTIVPLHSSLLKRGVYLSYDQFALTPIPQPGFPMRPAEDSDRVRAIVALVEENEAYLHQLLLSQDVSTHEQLAVAHGTAYAHLLRSVCPQLREAGLTDSQIGLMLRQNPAAFLGTPSLPTYANRDPVDNFGKSAWYWHRSVRSPLDSGGLYFSPDHVPILRDAALQALSDDQLQEVLAGHLAMLLRFTVWLEMNPVLQVCQSIFEGRFARLALPEPTRQLALHIITDEVSHTDLCFEYLRQLEQSVPVPNIDVEGFHQRGLQAFVDATPEDFRNIAMLAYVVASETTFTSALDIAPTDQRVRRQIRELLRDHADDERRHQEYFSGILRSLWVATQASERKALAELLIRALETFLWPDPELLNESIACLIPAQSHQIVDRVMHSQDLLRELRRSAEPMIVVLREVGAFHDADIVDVFTASRFRFDKDSLHGVVQ